MTKAHTIRNYPGLPDITGTDLADKLKHHLDVMGVEITEKQVTTVYAMGSYFGIQTPDIMYEASSVILAGGVVMGKPFPGEDELLGRGVSYCATCDAHFYKGKAVAVLGYNAESCREADFLAETCARVLYFPVVPHEVNVGPNVTVVRERVLSIPGTMRAEGVQTDKDLHPVDGVFVLRAIPMPNGGCRVEVEDHGPGIPPEELPHLFDRYYRARQDAGKTGTGLGLSITKAILQQHDFPFGVNSTVGKGSTFWFEMKAPQ